MVIFPRGFSLDVIDMVAMSRVAFSLVDNYYLNMLVAWVWFIDDNEVNAMGETATRRSVYLQLRC